MIRQVVVASFAQWRSAARALLDEGVAPHDVQWVEDAAHGDLLSGVDAMHTGASVEEEPDVAAHGGANETGSVELKQSADDGHGDLFGNYLPHQSGTAAPAEHDLAVGKYVANVQHGPDQDGALASSGGNGADAYADGDTDASANANANVDPDLGSTPDTSRHAPVRIPRQFMAMLQQAACFRVDDRWAFLYKLVWRWQRGERDVVLAADEDGARLHAMVKSVHREEHKMHAYLRFRERLETDGPPRFVAWFEPAHDVLPQVAGHFARRMGGATWLIGTPQGTMLWDGKTLLAGPPVMHGAADIDDAGEALWLTYYRSIFNPARLNTKVMQGHIPSRYWKNLPEGKLVPKLVSDAATGAQRVGQTQEVGARAGTTIPIAPDKAQPQREQPSSLDQCRRCELWQNATQAVPGVGPRDARIMLVGEQPGDQEDLAGKPFVGPAGQLLDNALREAGLSRETVFVTNAVKHFKWEPQGKRRLHKTPGQREINACAYWLDEELATVDPEVIVALGSTALKAVLRNPKATLTDKLGTPFQHGDRWIVTVYHPSYILRVPGEDAKAQAMAVLVKGLRQALEVGGRGDQSATATD